MHIVIVCPSALTVSVDPVGVVVTMFSPGGGAHLQSLRLFALHSLLLLPHRGLGSCGGSRSWLYSVSARKFLEHT